MRDLIAEGLEGRIGAFHLGMTRAQVMLAARRLPDRWTARHDIETYGAVEVYYAAGRVWMLQQAADDSPELAAIESLLAETATPYTRHSEPGCVRLRFGHAECVFTPPEEGPAGPLRLEKFAVVRGR